MIEFTIALSATHRKQTESLLWGCESACVSFELNSDHMNLSFYNIQRTCIWLILSQSQTSIFHFVYVFRQANILVSSWHIDNVLHHKTAKIRCDDLDFTHSFLISLFNAWLCGSYRPNSSKSMQQEKRKKKNEKNPYLFRPFINRQTNRKLWWISMFGISE